MESLTLPEVTRVLTDEGDYHSQGDLPDMFRCAQEGEVWALAWGCDGNRTVQVGDVIFFLNLEYEEPHRDGYGFFARGSVIAAEAENQLRQLDS